MRRLVSGCGLSMGKRQTCEKIQLICSFKIVIMFIYIIFVVIVVLLVNSSSNLAQRSGNNVQTEVYFQVYGKVFLQVYIRKKTAKRAD